MMMDESRIELEFSRIAGPQFRGWLEAMRRVNGCSSPVFLTGHTLWRDTATGDVVHVFSSKSEPYGRLAVPCGNRRESKCPSCSYLHHGDTYQIVVSGLAGGKGVPEVVSGHPRVFVTLTAPSFGAVHRVNEGGSCRAWLPWSRGRVCAHGLLQGCSQVHTDDDPLVGLALCEECYQAEKAVLWNAHVGRLWNRFTVRLHRELAAAGGVSAHQLREHARISFAKVVEYQRRGSVHLHAVVRIDGPGGAGEDGPDWATVDVLESMVRSAATRVSVKVAAPNGGSWNLGFGPQVDVQPIIGGQGEGLREAAVAVYIAKYVSKGDIPGLTWDSRLRSKGQIELLPLGRQGRVLMRAAFDLGEMEDYSALRLQAWAHQLGFRGNIATKSAAYSTTYTALRSAREEFRRAAAGVEYGPGAERESAWEFDGQGLGPGERFFAAGIASEVADRRSAGRHAEVPDLDVFPEDEP
jgi:hypothetical protein